MAKRFAVIGLGYFGQNIARELSRQGAEVIAIDNNMNIIEEIKDEVAYAVRLDSTDEKTLRNQGLEDLDAVIVSIGEDFENALLTCVLLQEFGCRHIIVKSTSPIHSRIFRSLGVHQVVSPDADLAERLAVTLINPNVLDTIPLTGEYSITQIRAPRYMIGRTLSELALRPQYGVNLITIKRETSSAGVSSVEQIIGIPTADTIIQKNDILILMGKRGSLEKLADS